MKMARSADAVLLHIDDAKDVSKLRAFLAVIPG
jgi:tRNA threonylcarbamoyladenosine modification (KEOPS) complex  Pcc1 subunit